MSKRIAVVISEDPCVTARPVEALRIALGLCAGDHETTVVLLGRASMLLKENTEEIIDVDVLEKYLPSFKHLSVPFIVEAGTAMDAWSDDFSVTTRTPDEIRQLVQSADRSLIF
ncbi:MAG TPA: DsrE family protein [Nitrospiraceae bacterium]|nr:DsrE family protein [Nitrospiraceae bacterium]